MLKEVRIKHNTHYTRFSGLGTFFKHNLCGPIFQSENAKGQPNKQFFPENILDNKHKYF